MHRVERGFGEEAASSEGAGRKGPREPGGAHHTVKQTNIVPYPEII